MCRVDKKVQKAYDGLISELKSQTPNPTKHGDGYGGHDDESLHLRVPTVRKIAKKFVKEKQDLTVKQWIELLHLLSLGKFTEEKEMVGKLLESNSELRKSINPREIENILPQLEGWSQVDSLCQSVFRGEEMLDRWEPWKKTIINLSESKNLNKKRASLVLLTTPVRQSDDERLLELAFSRIQKLKTENNKLVTKAISWLLREMIKNHQDKVKKFLHQNEGSLPSIAVREVRNKLITGKKT